MELTDQKKYVDRICELMAYEDSLFSVEKGNWIDMRKKNSEADGRRYMNAWCHGASGILLSRVKLGQRNQALKNEAEKIKKYIKDSIGKIPVHEKYNLGLMSGIVGIGVALLGDGELNILC